MEYKQDMNFHQSLVGRACIAGTSDATRFEEEIVAAWAENANVYCVVINHRTGFAKVWPVGALRFPVGHAP